MKILKEFREFAVKGNVVDMAVGIIIGGAFGKIVTSLVNDIIMPPVGLLIGGVDFSELKIVIKAATEAAPAVTINYGSFINILINFIIVALSIFLVVKALNMARRQPPPAPAVPPAPTRDQELLGEIRDLLKKR